MSVIHRIDFGSADRFRVEGVRLLRLRNDRHDDGIVTKLAVSPRKETHLVARDVLSEGFFVGHGVTIYLLTRR